MAINLDRALRRQFREQQKYLRMLKKYGKNRPYGGKCEKCGIDEPNPHKWVDEANMATTYNSEYLCGNCHRETYGVK